MGIIIDDRFSIYFTHNRYLAINTYNHKPDVAMGLFTMKEYSGSRNKWLSPLGGCTEARIIDHENDNKIILIAYAYCSIKDNYNRSIGREISKGRALKAFEEIRHETNNFSN